MGKGCMLGCMWEKIVGIFKTLGWLALMAVAATVGVGVVLLCICTFAPQLGDWDRKALLFAVAVAIGGLLDLAAYFCERHGWKDPAVAWTWVAKVATFAGGYGVVAMYFHWWGL